LKKIKAAALFVWKDAVLPLIENTDYTCLVSSLLFNWRGNYLMAFYWVLVALFFRIGRRR